jgi:putative molybdopterin biosynthesis protein
MTITRETLRRAARQEQFLDVIERAEAEARFHRHLQLAPLGEETVPLAAARGRVLARDIPSPVDVPGFDRASVDGFAVRSADTLGATADNPVRLRLNDEILTPGIAPKLPVGPGQAALIATGGMLPRGADAVVMVEHTEAEDHACGETVIEVKRPVAPGQFVAATGSDIAREETVLRRGRLLTSREIAILAAVGLGEVPVWRKPKVAIFSTGDEIVAPGGAIRPGQVYDSNAAVLAAAVEELGAEPIRLGIVPDDENALQTKLDEALAAGDVVLLSGGTSKGAGDIAYRGAARLADPGIVVHGVALKPGKPLCLAVSAGKPIAILPGFPTSAMFTFHTFMAPVIEALAGRPASRSETLQARLAVPVTSELGRTEYVLSAVMPAPDGGLAVYPTGKGSGAVTAFTAADGFFTVDSYAEQVATGTELAVTLIGESHDPADLTIIGSHCTGLDLLIGLLEQEGFKIRALNVGSSGGLAAARRGECDLAGVHLMDPKTGEYNRPYLTEELTLIPGYRRLQGLVFRPDDTRFATASSADLAIKAALADANVLMANRNAGSGTRILIDRLLAGARPPGYSYQARSHNGVAAAVKQGRADWGVAIRTVAETYGLGFLPLQDEQYDFVAPRARVSRPPVQRFKALLASEEVQRRLRAIGFDP